MYVPELELSQNNYMDGVLEVRNIMREPRKGFQEIIVKAPIVTPKLRVVLDRCSFWLYALRLDSEVRWWHFNDFFSTAGVNAPHWPDISKSDPIVGESNYPFLGIDDPVRYTITPVKLVNDLCDFAGRAGGKLGDTEKRRNMMLLIFLVSEAARFHSMSRAMDRFLRVGSLRFKEYGEIVQNWAKLSYVHHPEVAIRHIPSTPPAHLGTRVTR